MSQPHAMVEFRDKLLQLCTEYGVEPHDKMQFRYHEDMTLVTIVPQRDCSHDYAITHDQRFCGVCGIKMEDFYSAY